MDAGKKQELELLANNIRKDIVKAAFVAGDNGCHLGGCLSLAEILAVLYGGFIHFDSNDFEKRDRVIMSKGHGALTLYSILHQKGYVTEEELATFEHNGSEYTAHAHRNIGKGIEYTGGSLGLGMTFATGVAYACKLKGLNNHIYCILGDGELNEGVIWESFMFAAQKKLSNLTIIIDYNHLQIGGHVEDILDLSPLGDKLRAFGFDVQVVNGHDIEGLNKAFSSLSNEYPNAIIAETVKGKGVSFAEDKYKWHYGVMTKTRFNKAMNELTNRKG